MPVQPLRDWSVAPDDPPLREFGSLLGLLLASMLLSLLVTPLDDALRLHVLDYLSQLVGRQFVAAGVYAILGMVVLVPVAVAIERRRDVSDRLDRVELAQIVGAIPVVLFVAAYVLHGAVQSSLYPRQLVRAVLDTGLALVLPAAVYARLRGIDLHLGLPAGETRPLPFVVAQASLLVALVTAVSYGYVGGFHTFSAGEGSGFLPLTPDNLLLDIVLPGLLTAAGMAVLYHGVLSERLADRTDSALTVAAVTVLMGEWAWGAVAGEYVVDAGPAPPSLGLDVVGVGVFGVVSAVLLSFVAVRATAALTRSPGPFDELHLAAGVGIAVTVCPASVLAAIGVLEATAAVSGTGFVLVAAIAAVGYEHTRSVWVPALALAIFYAVTSPHVTHALVQLVL